MADRADQTLSIVPPATFSEALRQPTFVPGERRPPGRPSYLQADVEGKIMTALRAGNSIADSARYAGLKPNTVEGWIKRGRGQLTDRNATPDYQRFARMVDENRATARVYVVGNLVARSRTDTRAAELWLRVHGGPEWRDSAPAEVVPTIEARSKNVVVIPQGQLSEIVHGLLEQHRAAYVDPPIIEELDDKSDGLSASARAGLREDG